MPRRIELPLLALLVLLIHTGAFMAFPASPKPKRDSGGDPQSAAILDGDEGEKKAEEEEGPGSDEAEAFVPPLNDQCSGAEVIPAAGPFPYTTALTADITSATTTGDPVPVPPCTFGFPMATVSRSIWYRFMPSAEGTFTIASCADAPTGSTVDDTVMAIYTSSGGCGGVFTQVPGACNDDGCNVEDAQSVITSVLTAGTTYHIVVWEFGTAPPTAGNTAVQLRVSYVPPPPPPPANDRCAAAAVIPPAGPFPYLTPTVDITSATTADDPAFCAPLSHSVWYTLTPSETAVYEITTCQLQAPGTTVQDTVLGTFTSAGGCSGPFTPIACDDQDATCTGGSSRSRVTAQLDAGTTYLIIAGSLGGGTPNPGNLQLSIGQVFPPPNDTCQQALPLTLNLPVAGSTSLAAADYELAGAACFTGIDQKVSAASGGEVVYRFLAPATGAYVFRVTGYAAVSSAPPSPNLVLYVAGSCPLATPGSPIVVGSCLGAANRTEPPASATNSNTAEEVSCLPLSAGQVVFVFVDDDAAGGAGSGFRLEANRCAIESEPNGTPATASALSCGMEGTITPAGEADFYALGAPAANARVFALADGVAAKTNDVRMRVTTSADTLECDDDDNDTPFGALSPDVGGTILTGAASYLRIDHFSAAAQMQPYRLYAAIQPAIGSATAESEPNGTLAQASTNASNYFSGSLAGPAPSSDIDLFKFTAVPGALIMLNLDADPLRNATPINAAFALLDASGAVLVAVNDVGSTSVTTSGAGTLTSLTPRSPAEGIVYRTATGGTFYAKVSTGTTSATSIGAGDYLLSISLDCLAVDSDADGAADAQDCRPNDAAVWAAPSEAEALRLTGAGTTALAWGPPLMPGASSVRYDLLRSANPANFTAGTVCLATNTASLAASDPAVPSALFYYLVRSRNACGSTLGTSSAGTPRTGRTCP